MSTSGKLVSLKTIVERVYMDFGFNYSLSYTEAAEWAGSILALVKAPVVLKPQIEEITIEEARGKLPCDLEAVVQTAKMVMTNGEGCANAIISTYDRGTQYVEISAIDIVNRKFKLCGCNAFTTCDQCTSAVEGETCTPGKPIIRGYGGGCNEKSNYRLEPMRWATDTFHTKYHCTDVDFYCKSANTYVVNGNYIFTNFDHGKVLMSYLAIPTDDEGLPLIPADEWWRQAVTYEIAYKIAFKMMLQGNITNQAFQIIERERDWKVAQAVNKSKIPSIDEMESFKNQWLKLIPNNNNHSTMFKNMQLPEKMFNHPYRYF